MPREKENIELTDTKAKSRDEKIMSVERSARERLGVGTAKQSGVKNEKEEMNKKAYSSVLCDRKGTTMRKCNGERKRWRPGELRAEKRRRRKNG